MGSPYYLGCHNTHDQGIGQTKLKEGVNRRCDLQSICLQSTGDMLKKGMGILKKDGRCEERIGK